MTETEILTAEILLLRNENQNLRDRLKVTEAHLKEAEEQHSDRVKIAQKRYKNGCSECRKNDPPLNIRKNNEKLYIPPTV